MLGNKFHMEKLIKKSWASPKAMEALRENAQLKDWVKRYEKYNNRLEGQIAQLKGEVADLKELIAKRPDNPLKRT